MSRDLIKKIYKNKIIAVMRGVSQDKIVDTARALLKGGIVMFEIPYNQKYPETAEDTLNSISLVKKEFGDRIIAGPGTTLSVKQVADAADAGADYIISPNFDVEVVKKTKEIGKVSIAGAFTPTEITTAYNAGADFVKIFPGQALGLDYIKNITAPLNHIPLIVFGGINAENINDFIKAGAVGFGVGGSLIDLKAINNGDFDKITKSAQELVKGMHPLSLEQY